MYSYVLNWSLSMSCTFLVSARKVPQRSRHRRGASSKCALSYVPHPPHRHPAFKNVPIFERLHSANLQVCTVEPAENRNIFSGRWSNAAGVGSGASGAFARNASPRTTSLVTFLFGHKKVTPIDRSPNCNLNLTAAVRNRVRQKESDSCRPARPELPVGASRQTEI